MGLLHDVDREGRGHGGRAPPSSSGRRALGIAIGGIAVLIAGSVGYVAGRAGEPLRAPVATLSPPTAETAATEVRVAAAAVAPRPAATPVAEPSAAPPAPPADPVAVRARVLGDAEAALAAMKSDLARSCWHGTAERPSGASASVTYDLTFDASGHEIARSVIGGGRGEDPAVADCLREVYQPISIAPPGAVVAVQVTVTLP